MKTLKNFFSLHLYKVRWLRRLLRLPPYGLAYVRSKGIKFFLFLGDLYGPSYHLMHWGVESYEPQNQKYVSRILSNGDVFIDVGANIGIYSLLAALEGPRTEVYAFEPEAVSRTCLEASIIANGLFNIQISSEALSSSEGEGSLFIDSENHGGSSLFRESLTHPKQPLQEVRVRLTTLDQFVSQKKLNKVNLIKIDVQEYEVEVLKGSLNTLREFRPIVLIECSAGSRTPANLPFQFFENAEYSVFDAKTEKIHSIDTVRKNFENMISGERAFHMDLFFFPNEKRQFFLNPRPNLVFLAEHLSFGGSERALIEYLSCLNREKYKLMLVLRDERPDNYLLRSVPEYVEVKTIYPAQESLTWWERFRRERLEKLDLTLRLKKAFLRLPKNSYICDFSSVLIKQAYYFSGYKKIYWIHGPKSQMDSMELKKFGLRLRAYDLILAVSEHLRTEMQTLLPNLKERVLKLYNPFDMERIKASALDDTELSKEDRQLIKDSYILAVGRFAAEKDFITLIKAYRIMRDVGFTKKLYIVGDGPNRAEIEEQISKENLMGDIVLLGARPNPYIWMKNAELFVHSAILEGFGLVLVEAMALQKAVVVTDSPVGPREVLEDGKFGILVPVKDPERLANGILKLLEDPNMKRRYEALSLKRAKDFRANSIVARFDQIIKSL